MEKRRVENVGISSFDNLKRKHVNFKANPYFENTKLTKTINFSDEETVRSIGTTINWKDGKCLVDESNDERKGNKRPLPLGSLQNSSMVQLKLKKCGSSGLNACSITFEYERYPLLEVTQGLPSQVTREH